MALDIKSLKNPEVLESVSEAVEREIEMGNFMLKKCNNEMHGFEEKFNLTSSEFLSKFEAGELGDMEEYFEWYSAIKAKERWSKKLRALKKLSK